MGETMNIDKDILENAKFSASKVDDKYLRKRAFALNLAANAASKFLNDKGLKISVSHSLYKSPAFAKEIELADIYCEQARFDVRVTFNNKTFCVPKSHVKYDVKPCAYIVVKLGTNLDEVEFLGFAAENELNYPKSDSEYYTFSCEILKPIDDFIEYAKKLKIPPHPYDAKEHENIKEICVNFIDNQANEGDKIYFIKHVVSCPVCRETFRDMNDFDDIVSQLKNYKELLNDSTLSVLSGNKTEVDQAVMENISLVENAQEDEPEQSLVEPESIIGAAADGITGAVAGAAAGAVSAAASEAIAGAAGVVAGAAAEAENLIEDVVDTTASIAADTVKAVSGSENEEADDILHDTDDMLLEDLSADELSLDIEPSDEFLDINHEESTLDSVSVEPENTGDVSEEKTDDVAEIDEIVEESTAESIEEPLETVEDETDSGLEQEETHEFLEELTEEPELLENVEELTMVQDSELELSDEPVQQESQQPETVEEPVAAFDDEEISDLKDDDFILLESDDEEILLEEHEPVESIQEIHIEELPADNQEPQSESVPELEPETQDTQELALELEPEPLAESDDSAAMQTEELEPLTLGEEAEPTQIDESDSVEENIVEETGVESSDDVQSDVLELGDLETLDSLEPEEEISYAQTPVELKYDDEDEQDDVNEIQSADVENPVNNGVSELENANQEAIEFADDSEKDENVENIESSEQQPAADEDLQELLDDDLLALLSDDDEDTVSTAAADEAVVSQISYESVTQDSSQEVFASESEIQDTTVASEAVENLYDGQEIPAGDNVELDISQEPVSEETIKKTKKLAVSAALIMLLALGGAAGAWYINHKNAMDKEAMDAASGDQMFDFQNQGENSDSEPAAAAVPQDINKSMTNSFSDKPAAISITKLSWQISEKLAVEPSVKEYLQTAGKNIQMNLQNDLANAADIAFNNTVKVSFEIAPDNTMKGIQVLESSGSDKIDEMITKSIKNTLKYVSVPKLQNYKSDYFLTLIINF